MKASILEPQTDQQPRETDQVKKTEDRALKNSERLTCNTNIGGQKTRVRKLVLLLILYLFAFNCMAQKPRATDSVMITIFLKHQEDKNLDSLQAIQKKNKFGAMFPPAAARIVSWYVMMGVGQVVTLKIPAGELRSLNMAIEKGAWGAFNTEFYPTYDFLPLWKEERTKVGGQ